jgi:hypothetical protein
MLNTAHQRLSTPPRQRAARWLQLALALALALGALAALPPVSTRAATLTVTNGNDSGPGSLRQAILDAAAGDTITFAPGVTTVTLTTAGLVINKSVTIRGVGVGGVTVQRSTAGGTPNFRVFFVGGAPTVTLDGLTIRNGVALDTLNDNGGGIFVGGNLTLLNSLVSGNTARDGGGIGAGGSLALTNTTVGGNTATNAGGGIFNAVDSVVTLTNSTVSGNSAPAAGGIYNFVGTVTLTNSTVSGNIAGSNDGGGIFNQGTATLTGVTISGNRARDGGGIYNYNDTAVMRLTNSTISGNTARDGGAIVNFVGAATLTGTTVTGNSASASGGGIRASGFLGLATAITLRASIVAGNSAPGGADCATPFSGYPLTSQGGNVVGSGTGCPANGPGDLAHGGALANLLNPVLASNGGPTQTHALPLGSPAIGRVAALRCSDIATDQRGVHRPQGGNCDSGAFELSHFTLTFSAVGPGTVRATTSGLPLGSTLPPTSSHPQGKVVALSATPAAGARFVGWAVNGKPAGATNPLSLTMSENLSVVATFEPLR